MRFLFFPIPGFVPDPPSHCSLSAVILLGSRSLTAIIVPIIPYSSSPESNELSRPAALPVDVSHISSRTEVIVRNRISGPGHSGTILIIEMWENCYA